MIDKVSERLKVLGYSVVRERRKYVRRNLFCPKCKGDILVYEKSMSNGLPMGIEACLTCGYRSSALQTVRNFNKRTNSTLEKWSDQVKLNYGGRCAACGSRENLEAHHIFPVKKYPEYKYLIATGICLCRNCHRKIHGDTE